MKDRPSEAPSGGRAGETGIRLMGLLHVGHIKSALKKRFASLIDLSDVERFAKDRERFFLTRSLAAFLLAEHAGIDDKIAARAIVDGFKDNGIDAFYFDAADSVCYILQSKWNQQGKGTVELGDVLKFIHGVKDLLQCKLDNFDKLKQKTSEIDAALADASSTFVMMLAYTGEQELSVDCKARITEFLNAENDTSELIEFRPLRQKDIHAIVRQQAVGESLKLSIMLREWGKVTEPYEAYYGQVALEEIVKWKDFGQSLYDWNLRGFRGNTDVNEGIVKTAKEQSDKFWYFNNGITIVCDSLAKTPHGGSSRASGLFECEGASVVNGAQTVGSIITASESVANGPQNARVLVRLISLANCPPDFRSELTRAANTQNRIEKKDFAALDPEQDRLKTELLLECEKIYSYRTGDRQLKDDEGCTLDEAAIALACGREDVTLCVHAKREVSKLFENIKEPPYTTLFNPALSALKLWRSTLVLRSVESTLKAKHLELVGRDRLVAVHGNRFILHHVFRRLGAIDTATIDFEKMLTQVPTLVEGLLGVTISAVQELYPNSYPASLFKSASKCKPLSEKVTQNGPASKVKPDESSQLQLLER